MTYNIQKLFICLGYKKGYNKISAATSVGKYAHLMFENVSNPLVGKQDAIEWVTKHKDEIIQAILVSK